MGKHKITNQRKKDTVQIPTNIPYGHKYKHRIQTLHGFQSLGENQQHKNNGIRHNNIQERKLRGKQWHHNDDKLTKRINNSQIWGIQLKNLGPQINISKGLTGKYRIRNTGQHNIPEK